MSPLTESTRLTLAKQSVAPGLLDAYGGAAAAYSLRRLSANYTGPVVRVRRSSDSTEQDFSATQVTDGTLTTFCGAGNGFVRTWYDQSGNGNHAEQSTMANQPLIVQSGTLVTESGLPCLDFNGVLQRLATSLLGNIVSTTFCVAKGRSESSYGRIFGFGQEHSVGTFGSFSTWGFYKSTATISSLTGYPWSARTLVSLLYRERSTCVLAGNSGSGISFTHTTTTSIGGLTIGDSGEATECGDVLIQELIYYANNQSSNQAAIVANINAHYAIY